MVLFNNLSRPAKDLMCWKSNVSSYFLFDSEAPVPKYISLKPFRKGAVQLIQLNVKPEIMKKIIEDSGKDSGALNPKKKTGAQPLQHSVHHLKSDKIEPEHLAGTKKRRLNENDESIKKSALKHGSRRNLL